MKNWSKGLKLAFLASLLLMLRFVLVIFIPILLLILHLWKLGLIVLFLFYLLNIFTLIPIFKNDRSDPQTKLSWAIAVFLFPGGEFILWYNGARVPKKDEKKLIESQLLQNGLINGKTFNQSKITKLENGYEKYLALFERLNNAKYFINFQYFIITDGIIWKKIENILIKKQNEGVKIRIFVDSLGVIHNNKHIFDKIKKSGIKFASFNKMNWIWPSGYMNFRSHNKIVIIDNEIVFFGGLNIGDEYASLSPKYGVWIDIHYILEGEIVESANALFISQWYLATNEDISNEFKKYEIKKINNYYEKISFFAENPISDIPLFLNKFHEEIKNSKKSIKMITPYIILPYSMIIELKKAIERGVDVEIITIGLPDKKIAYHIGNYHVEFLNQIGAKVFRSENSFIHSKMYIFDEENVIFGTTNLDFRALYLHFESNIYVKDKIFANELIKQFIKNKNNSYLTTNTRNDWGLYRKTIYKILRWSKGLL